MAAIQDQVNVASSSRRSSSSSSKSSSSSSRDSSSDSSDERSGLDGGGGGGGNTMGRHTTCRASAIKTVLPFVRKEMDSFLLALVPKDIGFSPCG